MTSQVKIKYEVGVDDCGCMRIIIDPLSNLLLPVQG